MYPNKHVFPGWSQVLSVVFFSHCLSRLFRWPLGCQCSTALQHMMGPKQPRSIWWVCVSFCLHHMFQTWRCYSLIRVLRFWTNGTAKERRRAKWRSRPLLTRVSYRSLLHKCEVSCSFLDRSVPSTMGYRSVSKNASPECLAACRSVLMCLARVYHILPSGSTWVLPKSVLKGCLQDVP